MKAKDDVEGKGRMRDERKGGVRKQRRGGVKQHVLGEGGGYEGPEIAGV